MRLCPSCLLSVPEPCFSQASERPVPFLFFRITPLSTLANLCLYRAPLVFQVRMYILGLNPYLDPFLTDQNRACFCQAIACKEGVRRNPESIAANILPFAPFSGIQIELAAHLLDG